MSVYVGIDVHRKRSQVAVVDQTGQVLANRNVPNGIETVLRVIGELPPLNVPPEFTVVDPVMPIAAPPPTNVPADCVYDVVRVNELFWVMVPV